MTLLSQLFSDLEGKEKHYSTAFDIDIDIFEFSYNEENDSDDESCVDDYLKLMKRFE